jgi:hypothetical protein
MGFDMAVGLTGLGPRDDAIEMTADHAATSFTGSTLECGSVVHHCLNMVATTLICLRSRMSCSCSR